MTETAEAVPSHQVVNHPGEDPEEPHRRALLAALRVAHAKAKIVIFNIEDIGTELKEKRLTPREAMRECLRLRIDALFPREGDGA